MLIKYLSDLSKRHADKLLCPITGTHRFPSLPVISAKMWSKVSSFDVRRLLLTRTDRGTKSSAWEAELNFFDVMYETHPTMKFTEMIDEYRRAGHHPRMARSSIGALFMPTTFMMTILKNKHDPPITTTAEAAECVDTVVADYEFLFNNPADLVDKYPGNTPEDTFDIMDAFTRITPLPSKVGEMVFLDTCVDAYQKYTCVEAIVLSMIYNPNLCVPDTERAKQLKGRKVDKPANPFNTKRVKELKAAQAEEEALAAPNWKPELCVFESARAGSAVALAMQRQSGASAKVVQPVARVAAEPLPSSGQDEVEDSLQKPVDPKRLVSSRGKGPVKPRIRVHPQKVPYHFD
jgi:hypothetical protein